MKIKISKKNISESTLSAKDLANLEPGTDIKSLLLDPTAGPPPAGSPEFMRAQRKLAQPQSPSASSDFKRDIQRAMRALEDELVSVFKSHMASIADAETKQKAEPEEEDKTVAGRKRE